MSKLIENSRQKRTKLLFYSLYKKKEKAGRAFVTTTKEYERHSKAIWMFYLNLQFGRLCEAPLEEFVSPPA